MRCCIAWRQSIRFPAAVDDSVAVYKELIKTYKPQNIALYGTSAGAILTAEVAVKLRQLGLPLPGAMGVFSGSGDFSRYADSQAVYSLSGLKGPLQIPGPVPPNGEYVGNTDRRDPVLSPLFANLQGFPPTLFCDQHTRSATEQHDYSSPRVPRGRCRCRTCGL